ncbi:GyrI-like domain-containing protein [Feifania hominis]|uniref:GyrI-like domain-containing protein n=1 Tax=Feifania hominis TaxID=2763660 RepID=A0A926DE22_9FIRM|nr:GyrI-like domain-containing protein [Feifania hominis]MBC8535320.1 GyrI-like domain-containing protein [Feifania hominis]
MDKLDFKKEYRDLYLPKSRPVLIEVPPMPFLMVDGEGAPESESYQSAIGLLYTLSFTVKMSKFGPHQPQGYVDYVLPPLEGLWDSPAGGLGERDRWSWTAMIRLPDYVTDEVFAWALAEAHGKKPGLDYARVRREVYREGLCVQMLHIGPYAAEPESLRLMQEYLAQHGLRDDVGAGRRHHEIYLSDPRRVAPEKLRTVLRHPVRASGAEDGRE